MRILRVRNVILLIAFALMIITGTLFYYRDELGGGLLHHAGNHEEMHKRGAPEWFEELDPMSIKDSTSFRVETFAYNSSSLKSVTSSSVVSIATQCSVDKAHHLAAMAETWRSKISVAILVLRKIGLSLLYLSRLRECSVHVRDYVDIHLVYIDKPNTYDDFEAVYTRRHYDFLSSNIDANVNPFKHVSCAQVLTEGMSALPAETALPNYTKGIPYPNNLLRNVARSKVLTPHVMSLDVDMVPSRGLPTAYEKAVVQYVAGGTSMEANTAFVVASFEVRTGTDMPHTKDDLIRMWDAGSVRPFYYELCWKCQNPLKYEEWRRPSTEVVYSVPWRDPWEPFYGSQCNSTPLYDIRFQQYGFNRVSQFCELYIAGFKFVVLRDVFLMHDGFKRPEAFHPTKEIEQASNRELFRQFKKELAVKYPGSGRECYTHRKDLLHDL